MTKYKHCVFCASNEMAAKDIYVAVKTANELDKMFCLDNDVAECVYRSEIKINDDDGGNTSIWLSNKYLTQLIDDCMRFAIELNLSNKRAGIKPPWIK